MKDDLYVLFRNKLMCTGVGPMEGDLPVNMTEVDSKSDFDRNVTTYYLFFRENYSNDIAFLQSVKFSEPVKKFSENIYLLRTAVQHSDNERATRFYELWKSDCGSWPDSARILWGQFVRAVKDLAAASVLVSRQRTLSIDWRGRATLSPEAVFDAVCGDLSVSFPSHRRAALVSGVKARTRSIRAGQDYQRLLRAYCAEAATASGRSLPMPYSEILDQLGLIGSPKARSALLIAYAIGHGENLDARQFMEKVSQVWNAAS